MEKRYQVFVSSTFDDLRKERQQVMQALLELDCIPSGMELFLAADENQWTLIQRAIDDCDYYIVIIGGRYGSVAHEGKSFTQMEYEYAVERGKPVIAFVHRDRGSITADKSESSEELRAALDRFIQLVKEKEIRDWLSPDELGSVVSRSVVKLIKNKPAIGWVRANFVADEGAAQEILRLRREIDDLNAKVQEMATETLRNTKHLAQGDEDLLVRYGYDSFDGIPRTRNFETCWNEVIKSLGPHLLNGLTESEMRAILIRLFWDRHGEGLKKIVPYLEANGLRIVDEDFQKVKVQLRALGLIERVCRDNETSRSSRNVWVLTDHGDSVMTGLIAIPSRHWNGARNVGTSVSSSDLIGDCT